MYGSSASNDNRGYLLSYQYTNIMKDQNASKEEVQSVFNAWWFKFSLFGAATVIMAIWGTPLWTGFAAGLGVMSFFTYFGKR